MKIDTYFDKLWYVHKNDGKTFDSMWTKRNEARKRKRELKALGEKNIKLSFVPVSYGTIQQDSHS